MLQADGAPPWHMAVPLPFVMICSCWSDSEQLEFGVDGGAGAVTAILLLQNTGLLIRQPGDERMGSTQPGAETAYSRKLL